MCETHDLSYNSRWRYTAEDGIYKLEWFLNDEIHPLVMMGDFENEDQFFEYIKKEINDKRFFLRKHFIAKMTDSRTTL